MMLEICGQETLNQEHLLVFESSACVFDVLSEVLIKLIDAMTLCGTFGLYTYSLNCIHAIEE